MSSHNQPTSFKCRVCGATFTSKNDFNVHLTALNHRDVPSNFKCRVCSGCFLTKKEFNQHLIKSGHLQVNSSSFNATAAPRLSPAKKVAASESDSIEVKKRAIRHLRDEFQSDYTRNGNQVHILCDLDALLDNPLTKMEKYSSINVKEFSSFLTKIQRPERRVAVYHAQNCDIYSDSFEMEGWELKKSPGLVSHHMPARLTQVMTDIATSSARMTIALFIGDDSDTLPELCNTLLQCNQVSLEIYSWTQTTSEKMVLLLRQFPGRVQLEFLEDVAHLIFCSKDEAENDSRQAKYRLEHTRRQEKIDAKLAANLERLEYECPLTGQILEDPVLVNCCYRAFSKEALEKHVADQGGNHCPTCQLPFLFSLRSSAVSHQVEQYLARQRK